jgi:hypothetical protein
MNETILSLLHESRKHETSTFVKGIYYGNGLIPAGSPQLQNYWLPAAGTEAELSSRFSPLVVREFSFVCMAQPSLDSRNEKLSSAVLWLTFI